MTEHRNALYTRRSVLGLAMGLLAAGCAEATRTAPSPRAATGFPHPEPWCWKQNTAKPLDLLGRVIMQERNPYCQLATTNCDATKPGTWPHELTDEATWKILTEFDFQPAANQPWHFIVGTPPLNASVTRSMRIPYLIKHSKAKKKKVAINVGRENLLVGFEPNTNPVPNPQLWGEPDTTCNDHSVGELARFITDNMARDGHTHTFSVENWSVQQAGSLEPGTPNTTWYFRRAPIVVDYSFRFPVATGQVAAPASASSGWIYVGYEGGGAY
jgi:hypothetical protein